MGSVVLAYSGGLDTSVAIHWIKEKYNLDVIALTIDDGPANPYTEEMLDILKKYGIHATFFLIGQNAERYPNIVRRIWAEGHEIGNHSYTHPNIGTIGVGIFNLACCLAARPFSASAGACGHTSQCAASVLQESPAARPIGIHERLP